MSPLYSGLILMTVGAFFAGGVYLSVNRAYLLARRLCCGLLL